MEFLDIIFWKGLVWGIALTLVFLIIKLGFTLANENNAPVLAVLYGLAIPFLLGAAVLFYIFA